MPRSIFAIALIALLALAAPVTARASVDAWVDCSLASNHCNGDAENTTGPVRLIWSFDTNGTDAIFPQDCTDQTHCRFWCPRYPGPIVARLYVFDTSFNLLAVSAPAPALCTEQDVVLGGGLQSTPSPDR